MPQITGVAHVELSVRDLDASVCWYSELLGAREVFRAPNEERGFEAVAIHEPVSGMVLAFTCHKRAGDGFSELRPGLDHLAFGVADREALEAWQTRLDELGIAHDGIDDQGVAAGLNFRDPDGIALEFFLTVRQAKRDA